MTPDPFVSPKKANPMPIADLLRKTIREQSASTWRTSWRNISGCHRGPFERVSEPWEPFSRNRRCDQFRTARKSRRERASAWHAGASAASSGPRLLRWAKTARIASSSNRRRTSPSIRTGPKSSRPLQLTGTKGRAVDLVAPTRCNRDQNRSTAGKIVPLSKDGEEDDEGAKTRGNVTEKGRLTTRVNRPSESGQQDGY